MEIGHLFGSQETEELIAGGLILLALVYATGRKLGIFPAWNFKASRETPSPGLGFPPGFKLPDKCPDPECHNQMLDTAKELGELKKFVTESIAPKVERTAKDVAYIRGWIDGLKDGKSD